MICKKLKYENEKLMKEYSDLKQRYSKTVEPVKLNHKNKTELEKNDEMDILKKKIKELNKQNETTLMQTIDMKLKYTNDMMKLRKENNALENRLRKLTNF